MPLPVLAELGEVLARYGLSRTDGTEPQRASTGFSGADVWQVATSLGPLCVRRWPAEHPTPAGLRRIHDVLRGVLAAGCRFVPAPLPDLDGNTVTQHQGRLWEVTNWLHGTPDDSPRIDEERLCGVWRALGAFHLASLQQGTFRNALAAPRGPSRGIAERLQKLDYVTAVGLAEVRHAAVPVGWERLTLQRDEYAQLLGTAARQVRPVLVAVAADQVDQAVCIRDIRREHVLFTGDEVTGWVDFGALALESPAADAARVLGEFCDERRPEWVTLLAPYQHTCRGTSLESCSLHLVDAFDRSGTLLAPWNWLRWIFLEDRDFPDRDAVVRRFDQLLARLRRMVETA
jgi:Ser/Thr protein kinase RdoA (MazF antagonist)